MKENPIKACIDNFYVKINDPIIQPMYISNSQNWDAICASLSVILDIQRIKREYLKLNAINHLNAIGIIQALYIEQDSVNTLTKSILKDNTVSILNSYSEIRNLRNRAFGHPTEKRSKKKFSRHFFDVIDQKKQLIKIINWNPQGSINAETISLASIVKDNSDITIVLLKDLYQKFMDNINQVKKEYTIVIQKLFQNYNYTFSKLLSKINDDFVIKPYESQMTLQINEARQALIERNLNEDYFKIELDKIEFLNSKLVPLLNKQDYRDIEFYTYAVTLRNNIKEFLEELNRVEVESKK